MTFRTRRIAIIIGILAGAVLIAVVLIQARPEAEKKPPVDLDMLVDVLELQSGSAQFTIRSHGTVQPRTETVLIAEIAGTIVSVSPKFVAGGVFAANETLMRIDPVNYEAALQQAEALVRQRQIEFDGAKRLRAQGYRAEAELASAEAALTSAKAQRTRAAHDLEKTFIRLPYEGLVRARDVDVGQYVSPGVRLGVAFSVDVAEVRLPLADKDLRFVALPAVGSGGDAGPSVRLSGTQFGHLATWDARIARTEGVVDEASRVTYAVAVVEDPYALHGGDDDHDGDNGTRHGEKDRRAPLPIGTFVVAEIQGIRFDDVIRVPRQALRSGSQLVFVDEENRLRVRHVDVLRADDEYAFIEGGARPGERISVTAIEAPINGMRVRTSGDDSTENAEVATVPDGSGE